MSGCGRYCDVLIVVVVVIVDAKDYFQRYVPPNVTTTFNLPENDL